MRVPGPLLVDDKVRRGLDASSSLATDVNMSDLNNREDEGRRGGGGRRIRRRTRGGDVGYDRKEGSNSGCKGVKRGGIPIMMALRPLADEQGPSKLGVIHKISHSSSFPL